MYTGTTHNNLHSNLNKVVYKFHKCDLVKIKILFFFFFGLLYYWLGIVIWLLFIIIIKHTINQIWQLWLFPPPFILQNYYIWVEKYILYSPACKSLDMYINNVCKEYLQLLNKLHTFIWVSALDREQADHQCLLTFSCKVRVPPAVQVKLDQESAHGQDIDHNNTLQQRLIL